ncbi:MAG: hypothetical protein HY881_11895 [Deltaproteobacteria bacterium]|nr:hypothetical protein [Deltaproteobacteria bacterium]
MTGRKSDLFFIFLLVNSLLVGLMFFHARVREKLDMPLLNQRAEIVRVLGLTDLCLFTEARYTRHPSMADISTPFQDHPMSLEHFPSGAILPAPPHLKQRARE